MKKITLLATLTVFSLCIVNFATAQSKKGQGKGKVYIEAFDDGRTLTATDIKFLNGINGNYSDSREAVVSSHKYRAGQRLTSVDAAIINKNKGDYRRKHRMEMASDGRAINNERFDNCHWYHHCLDNSACYYIWYRD